MQPRKYPRIIESGGVVLTLTPDEVYVEFGKEFPADEVNAFVSEYDLAPVKEYPGPLSTASLHELFPERHWLRLPPQKDVEQYIDRLHADRRIQIASPVYHREDLLPKKTGLSFSNFVLVRLHGKAGDSQEIKKLFTDLGEDVSGPLELPDSELHRLRIRDSIRKNAFEVADEISKRSQLVMESGPDWMQLNSAITATIPDDTLYVNQWNMGQIGAPDGWDLSTGDTGIVIAILDTGCDLNHEDLSTKYVPVADRGDVTVTPTSSADDWGHGTCCAGIAAAQSNNARGVAGVAWNCRIMPIRMMVKNHFDTQLWIANAVNWAITHGANVISMSFGWVGPKSVADAAIAAAAGANIVMVAAAGNDNYSTISYPSSHPSVIAVGATDISDHRKCPPGGIGASSPDRECWGSNYGTGLSVMAPGVNCWSTDIMAGGGYNYKKDPTTGRYGGGVDFLTSTGALCRHYDHCGDGDGNYFSLFSGTSAATPHVAGLAALLLSLYTLLRFDSQKVRNIIEQTAEKAGGYTYASDVSHPNGTWDNQMGYGRINVFRALNFADVYIRDSPLDNGGVPFTAGPFWDNSDIVVRNSDDDVFEHQSAIKGRDNYIKVRVTNLGPATARNVSVRVYAVPFAGTEFVFPEDWTASPTHMEPESMISHFDSIDAPGTFFAYPTATAKFKLKSSLVDMLYGWTGSKWHPCLLAVVTANNDYGTPVGTHSWEGNNLAQRNISIVRVDRPDNAASGTSSATLFPFLTGNKLNMDLYMEIVINRSSLPEQAEVLLNPSDTDEYFPALEKPETVEFHPTGLIKFLDRTRLLLSRSNFKGIMTLAAGSTFEDVGNHEANITIISQQDAKWESHAGKRLIAIRGDNVIIGVQKQPGELRQMSLNIKIPDGAKLRKQYQIAVSQRNTQGQVVGGVSLLIEAQGY